LFLADCIGWREDLLELERSSQRGSFLLYWQAEELVREISKNPFDKKFSGLLEL